MARRSSNIDPFNAGEPVMPWDDPQSQHGSCSLPDDDYQPPTYEAPVSDSDGDRKASGSGKGRPSSKAGSKSGSGGSSKKGSASKGSGAKARGGSGRSSTGKGSGKKPQKEGGAKRGVRRFIRVIVILGLISVGGDIIGSVVDGVGNHFDSGYDSSYNSGSTSSDDIDEEAGEQQVTATIEDHLSKVADDSELQGKVAAAMDARLKSWLGYGAADLGIDAPAGAKSLLQTIDCQVTSAYCFDGYDGQPPSGSVYIQGKAVGFSTVLDAFYDDANTYLSSLGIYAYEGSSSIRPLSDDEKAQIGVMWQKALTASSPEDVYESFDFSYQDGAWVLDEAAYDESMGYAVGVNLDSAS